MKANVNYKGVDYEDVELASIKEFVVSFRIYTNQPNYHESIEQLVNDDADVDFFSEHAFVIVKRKNVSSIVYR